jgi:hypothetical protein
MGKFDRKISKNEPEAPNSQKILKKKSNAELSHLQHNPKEEKSRNMKILQWMSRAEEVKSVSKANSHLDIDKMVKKQMRKEQ